MDVKRSKNSTGKNNFYFSILNELKSSTNLSKIQKKLNISKQNLSYYLRQMKKEGILINPSRGLWKQVKISKNSTKYGNNLKKDLIRGHAYIMNIIPDKLPEDWNKRLELIRTKEMNYKLVGALNTTPRIKALGRKVWLCNTHLRIYLKKGESFYGENAIESRKKAFWEFYKILDCLENKLGINLKPCKFDWQKEHYALIKNDLAIEHNQKGEILRISDEDGEWLIADDSLRKGGELENVGKKALVTNIKMKKWWNENKKDNFKTTNPIIIKKKFKELEEENKELLKIIKKLSLNEIMFSQLLEQFQNNQFKSFQIINKRLNEAGL